MFCYHLVTNPGLEDIVATEARRLLHPVTVEESPEGRTGVTALYKPQPVSSDKLSRFRSIYHAIEQLGHREIPDLSVLGEDEALNQILALAERTEFPGIDATTSIAVRCRRRGDHRFRSPAIERTLGAHLVERYRCPVNLEEPDVTVRVDIEGRITDLGLLVTPPQVDRRYRWWYRPRVTLSTVAAYGLLTLSGFPEATGAILDPFCGSGTIPIEAATGRSRSGASPVFASDISPEAVAGTRANLRANNLSDRVFVRTLDATDPRCFAAAWSARGIETIVCNPPYGVRLGRKIDFGTFYDRFLDGAFRVLAPGGRLVMMSSRRRGTLNSVLADKPEWRLLHVRVIETGGVYPGIFVLERR